MVLSLKEVLAIEVEASDDADKKTHHSYLVIPTQHHIRQNLSLRRQRLTSSTRAAFTFLLCTCRRHLPFKPHDSHR
jgi:hypothetical protein